MSLMLDTPAFNAHTSAVDALWAGLPLLVLPQIRMVSALPPSPPVAPNGKAGEQGNSFDADVDGDVDPRLEELGGLQPDRREVHRSACELLRCFGLMALQDNRIGCEAVGREGRKLTVEMQGAGAGEYEASDSGCEREGEEAVQHYRVGPILRAGAASAAGGTATSGKGREEAGSCCTLGAVTRMCKGM
eukprot:759724-Hanusia_phi.AAC.2